MKSFALSAAILASATNAKISQLCLEETASIGFVNDQKAAMENGKHISDQAELQKIPINDLTFARPSKISVCADDTLIHGVQLSQKIHKFTDFVNEMSSMSELQVDMIFDGQYAIKPENPGKVYEMTMIGSASGTCTDIMIEDDDKLLMIDLEADGLMLRKMAVHLDSGLTYSFGGYEGPWNSHPRKTFVFEDKWDLLGMVGYISPDNMNSHDGEYHLSMLGFLANTCPIIEMIDFERHYKEDMWLMESSALMDKELETYEKPIIGYIIVSFLLGWLCCFGIYCMAKKNGCIGRFQEARDRSAHGQFVSNDSRVNDPQQRVPTVDGNDI